MKYLRSTTLSCKDIRIRKSEIVTKTQFHFDIIGRGIKSFKYFINVETCKHSS